MTILTSNPVLFTIQPVPSYVKKYFYTENILFAGSEITDGAEDGPALDARFYNLTDIATTRDGSQRPVIMNQNLFYTYGGGTLKVIHPCDMEI